MMSYRRWSAILVGTLACSAFMTGAARAQEPPFVESGRTPRFLFTTNAGRLIPLDIERTPSLMRRLSPSLNGVTLQQAITTIAESSGMQIGFSSRDLPEGKRVRLVADAITVAAALTEVLLGTGLDVVFSRDGRAALVKRDATMQTGVPRLVGTVKGRVTERSTNAPIPSVQVTIGGRVRYTDDKGEYQMPDVPPGEQTVSIRRVGFVAVTRRIRVTDGEIVTVDFALDRAATTLTEVVTTATGERSRLEVGNAIGTIKADSLVPTTLIRNMSDLLQARMPGVLVSNGQGAVGSSSAIRIRGISSLTLNNDPIIVLDGIRLNWLNTQAVGAGGGSTSQTVTGLTMALNKNNSNGLLTNRLDDLDPNTIESIDVLRGPSAATLYGTEAANGVIVIKTKKGGTGAWRLNLLADDGWSSYGSYPTRWRAWGVLANGGITNSCDSPLAAGFAQITPCQIDSVTAFYGNNDPNFTTLGTGTARNVSLNLSGGSQQLQEFLSVRGSDLVGVEQMSPVEQRRIQRMWGEDAPAWMVRPNAEQDWDGASRSAIRVSSALDLQLSVQGIYRKVRGAQSTVGAVANYLGPWDTLAVLPAENMTIRGTGLIKRGFVSTNVNYVPLSWLTLNAVLGGDYTLRSDNLLKTASACTVLLAPSTGCATAHTDDRGETFVTTANVGAQLSFTPQPWLGLRTAFGEQYSGTTFYELNAGNTSSTNLAFGTDLLTPSPVATSGTPQLFTVTETRDQSATAGYYIEQMVAWRERLFVTAALRQDAASAFGAITNQHLPTYPKFSLSWLASDESFFPFKDIVSSFRLRAAYGHSGNQARQTDRLPFYTVATVLGDMPTPVQGVGLLGIPNPLLKPERTTEAEGGFDLSFLTNERVHIEATMYRKISRDAIVNAKVPNSFGIQSGTQSQNVGSVENRGVELSLTAKLVDSRIFGWTVTTNFTENHNKLVSISAVVPSFFNNAGSLFVGYPLFGFWRETAVAYADLNGNGILEGNEIALSSGTPGLPSNGQVFYGPPYPRGEISYSSGFALFSGAIRVNTIFDQVNDFIAFNQNIDSPCKAEPAACTLAQQSEAIATILSGGSGVDRVSYLRFSELSATVSLPQAMARQVLHTRSATVTFAGRNLALWSNYVWNDPAQKTGLFSDSRGSGGQFSGLGQPKNWTLRFNLEF